MLPASKLAVRQNIAAFMGGMLIQFYFGG
jgi:hypothetical protein